jgi:hypothetical protein
MSADYDDSDWLGPWPFWFVSSQCLAEVLRAEIKAIIQLFAKYPDLRKLFDAPQVTIPERTMCFQLLAHRKVMEMIDQTLVDRYEPPLAFNEEESSALGTSANLVTSDAPDWTREMGEVTERLPVHIHRALPELLRERGFYTGDPVKDEAVRSAAKTLDTVEQIQALTSGVFDEQLKRLKERWSATIGQAGALNNAGRPSKRKALRTHDKQRMIRDKLIAEIDDVSETITEFLQLMDERKVRPQPTWSGWPGSWKEAYKNPRLRELIHKDKSRALSRAGRK